MPILFFIQIRSINNAKVRGKKPSTKSLRRERASEEASSIDVSRTLRRLKGFKEVPFSVRALMKYSDPLEKSNSFLFAVARGGLNPYFVGLASN
jgi:hypothetical protein